MTHQKKKYTLEDFKKEKIAINIRNKKDWMPLMELLERNGFAWVGGEKLTESGNWDDFREETCITSGFKNLYYDCAKNEFSLYS